MRNDKARIKIKAMSGKKIRGQRTLERICRVGSSWFGAEDEGKGETKDVTGF